MNRNRMMALFAAGTIFCGAGLFAQDAAPATESAEKVDVFKNVPEVVAEINGEKITKEMLVGDLLKMLPDQKIPADVTVEDIDLALPGIVKETVVQRLLNAEMAKAGVTPSAELVKKEMTKQLGEMEPAMLDIFKQQLMMKGQTPEEFIDEIAKEPVAQQQYANRVFMEQAVVNNVKVDTTVTAEEVRKFYDENKDKMTEEPDRPDQFRASHILIDDKADDAAALAKAKELIAALQKDPSKFEEFAAEYSTCPSKQRGGSLGVFGKGQMVPEFEQATEKLELNQITAEPVKTQFGYHIIRRDEQKPLTFEMVRADIEAILKNQKEAEEANEKQKAVNAYMTELEKKNNVKYMVKMPDDIME